MSRRGSSTFYAPHYSMAVIPYKPCVAPMLGPPFARHDSPNGCVADTARLHIWAEEIISVFLPSSSILIIRCYTPVLIGAKGVDVTTFGFPPIQFLHYGCSVRPISGPIGCETGPTDCDYVAICRGDPMGRPQILCPHPSSGIIIQRCYFSSNCQIGARNPVSLR